MKAQARVELREHWKTVLGAMVGVAFGPTGILFFTLGLFVKPLSETFGWSRAQVSSSTMAFQIGIILMSPVIGALTDRFGPRKVGLLAMLGLGFGLCGLASIGSNIVLFYAAWIMLAVLASGGTPVVWTRAVNSCFDKQRGIALGLSLSGTGIIAFVAPSFVSEVIAQFGWRTAYLVMAGLIVFLALPLVAYLLNDLKHVEVVAARVETGETLRAAMKTGWFWHNGISFCLVAGGLAAPILHLSPMLTDAGISIEQAGRIAGLLGVAMIVGRLALGWLVDRFPAEMVGMSFLLLSSLGCVLLIYGLPQVGVPLIGLATGAEVDLLAYLASRRYGMRHYGSIYGWQLSMSLVGVGIAAILMGAAYDHWGSYDVGLHVNVVISLIGAFGVGSLVYYGKLQR